MREHLVESNSGEHPAFTASFGLTDSTCARSLEELLKLADARLYEAKAAGRDRISISDGRSATGPVLLDAREDTFGTVERRRPATTLHSDADDEEPRPSGLEIR